MPSSASPTACAAALLSFTVAVGAQIRIDTYASRHVSCLTPGSTWPIEANDFATGDFDADGDLDLVIGSRSQDFRTTGGRVVLLRNEGNMVLIAR